MAIPKTIIKEVQKINGDQYKTFQMRGIRILALWIAQVEKEKQNTVLPKANTN
ncbi:hypothetical protein [Desulfotruncus alcoholivorax]|uniref:hypothetical protein n=1 Tax=Desulfotruncus alcoholivorax TaxID=265477 RepID=UPI00041AEFDA|nr:hypothetical protein [Desulfotruncus alcoholivorax]